MKAIRHIGIVVSNLDKALYFYRDLLGLKIKREMVETGKYIDDLSGLKEVRGKTIKLSADDGNIIELLYYESHHRKPINRDITEIGCSHVAFTVENVDDEYKRLRKKGVIFNSSPQEAILVKSGKVRIDFYSEDKKYIESQKLTSGDVVLLASGGQGFIFLEESELIEIKQGPYISLEVDKEKFEKPNGIEKRLLLEIAPNLVQKRWVSETTRL